MADPFPRSLLDALADLVSWLDETHTPAVLVGGVAVSLLGRPRHTQDIDALAWIDERDWDALLAAAPAHGIEARLAQPLEFARRTRVLLMRHASTAVDIDLILGSLTFERQAVERAGTRSVGGLKLRLPRVEDLLIMKAVAQRPRDQQDILTLLAAHPDADTAVVLQWVREFATAISMPSLVADLERLLAQRAPPG